MTWRDLLAGGGHRRDAAGEARRREKIERSMTALTGTVKEIQESVARVTGELRALHAQVEQLAALQAADRDTPARLLQLEPVLDATRVAQHLTDAFRRTEVALEPVPHLLVRDFIPGDLHDALVDAIPAPPLFQGGRGRPELALPPALAPVHAIVTWSFMAGVLRNTLGPAIVDRFDDGLRATPMAAWPAAGAAGARLVASRGRLVLRQPGDAMPRDAGRASHIVAAVVALDAKTDDARGVNVWLVDRAGAAPDAASPRRATITLPRNAALMFLTTFGVLEFPPASAGSPDDRRTPPLCTYEFTIGPSNRPRGEPRSPRPA